MKRGNFKVKITKPGIFFVLLTIVLGVAAINTGNNLLYLIAGLMLSIMALSGLSSFFNLVNLELSLETPGEIYASQQALLTIRIRNKKRYLPSFLLGMSTPLGISWLPYLPPKKGLDLNLWMVFPKRGWQNLAEITLSSYFPLRFFSRSFKYFTDETYLVYPKPIFSPLPQAAFSEGEEGEGNQRDKQDFRGLREFEEGDDLRYVHWVATAKLNKFILKEYRGSGFKDIVLSIGPEIESIEEHLSRLTYLTNTLIKAGYTVGLEANSLYLPPNRGERQRKDILKALALYEG
jgi:uncharacterized protein (DUF58 family)